MTYDLAVFLTARLDEEERVAKLAAEIMALRPTSASFGFRLLADIDAKRRIIGDENEGAALYAVHEAGYWNPDLTRFADQVLRLLALPYADHPDYDQAWRP